MEITSIGKELMSTRFHLGIQKARSTFLYNLLSNCSCGSLSSKSEVHYHNKYYERGIQWYLGLFDDKGAKIETSPKYFMKVKQVALKIRQLKELTEILSNEVDMLKKIISMGEPLLLDFYKQEYEW